MSTLFKPVYIGQMKLPNRLVHSATYEAMADVSGAVSEKLISRYKNLAKGEVGLIVPGYMYVDEAGKAMKFQTGIQDDAMIPGLKRLVDGVHQAGGRIVFQLVHAGRQTARSVSGHHPISPSVEGRDPVNFVKPKRMSEKDIARVVQAFGAAAARAVAAGADGIQLHAAHGYLINQFLSPFFNRRRDAWGGSAEKRFRFLKSIISAVRKEIPEGMPLMVKLNAIDYTPKPGITVELATTYAQWLKEVQIDCLEISCGTAAYSFMNLCRGRVPVREMVDGLPLWKKPVGRLMLGQMKGRFDLEEGYNIGAARRIKPVIGDLPLAVVGGLRRISQMNEVLDSGYGDLISMSRPFIREPFLAKRLKEKKQSIAGCVSCNKCLAAAANGLPVRCYYKDKPAAES